MTETLQRKVIVTRRKTIQLVSQSSRKKCVSMGQQVVDGYPFHDSIPQQDDHHWTTSYSQMNEAQCKSDPKKEKTRKTQITLKKSRNKSFLRKVYLK